MEQERASYLEQVSQEDWEKTLFQRQKIGGVNGWWHEKIRDPGSGIT